MRKIILVTGTDIQTNDGLTHQLQHEFIRRNVQQSFDVVTNLIALPQTPGVFYSLHRQRQDDSEVGLKISKNTTINFFNNLAEVRDSGPVVFANLTVGHGYSYHDIVNETGKNPTIDQVLKRLLMVIHPFRFDQEKTDMHDFNIFQYYLRSDRIGLSRIETIRFPATQKFREGVSAMVRLEGFSMPEPDHRNHGKEIDI